MMTYSTIVHRRSTGVVLVGAFLLAVACGQPAPVDKPAEAPVREAPVREAPAREAPVREAAADKPWPALDEGAAAKVASALDTVDPVYQPVIAARGLYELEQGRLGERLMVTLDSMAGDDPSVRAQLIAMGIDSPEGRAGWQQVCSGDFARTFAAFATVANADKVPLVRAACDPAKLRLLDRPSAGVDAMGLALAIIVYGTLERHGSVSAHEIKIIGALSVAESPPAVPTKAKR